MATTAIGSVALRMDPNTMPVYQSHSYVKTKRESMQIITIITPEKYSTMNKYRAEMTLIQGKSIES